MEHSDQDTLGAPSIGASVRDLEIDLRETRLFGNLSIPHIMNGLVVFAHGSGSSRFSPRNRFVASSLNEAGFATLLFDLLTPAEERRDEVSGAFRFDIGLLSSRLVQVTDWLKSNPQLSQLGIADVPIGLFGASTGAAAALIAASDRADAIKAVVSRGGRPDMAGQALRKVNSPTLLLVGSLDGQVIELNRAAFEQLRTPIKELIIVPGASHLFEEPGKLEEVARYAAQWFDKYLVPSEE